jgi:XapX domain-containing protein
VRRNGNQKDISMGYVISLGVGFGIGLVYWLLKVQSPAPPLVALAGLLGMVLGEHAVPIVKAQFFAQAPTVQIVEQAEDPTAPKITVASNAKVRG